MGFSVGSALRQSLAVLVRNAGNFGVVAVVFTLPAIVYSQMLLAELSEIAGSQVATGIGDPTVEAGSRIIAITFLGSLILFLLQALAAALLSYGTIRDLRGGPASLLECLSGSLPAAFRVLGITLLLGLFIVLASFVAAIPGGIVLALGLGTVGSILMVVAPAVAVAYIFTRYWVAIPVAVVEGTGVVASMKRSAALARGHGWRVFGLIAVLYVLNIAAAWIANLITGTGDLTVPSWPAVIFGLLVAAFFLAWRSVAAAVAYHDLRIAHEGHQGDQVARVFE